MFKWFKNYMFDKEIKNSKISMPELIKALKGTGRKRLVTMVAILGQENLILKKKLGLL